MRPIEGAGRRRGGRLAPSPKGLPREQVVAHQRERILTAMAKLIGEQGYDTARVQDVIERAAVSRRTFYELFEDKEDCFLSVYDRALGRLLTVTLDAFETTHHDWVDGVRAAYAAMLGMLAEDPASARICFVEIMTGGTKAIERRNEAMRGFDPIFEAGRAEAAHDLPALTGLNLLGGLSQILYREIAAGRTAELPQLLPELTYLTVVPFLGADAAARELGRPAANRAG